MSIDPSSDSPAPRRRSCLLMMTAALALVIVGGMALATGPFGIVLGMGAFAFFGLLALHYFVWGRWLSRDLDQDREPRNDSER